MSGLGEILRQLEATEANLSKLEELWVKMQETVPQGIAFGENAEYERNRMAYESILEELPAIDGWKPDEVPRPLDAIAQARFDARELGEPHIAIDQSRWEDEPGRQLRRYRFEFDQKRRELVREVAQDVREEVDGLLTALRSEYEFEDIDDPEELGHEIKNHQDFKRLEELVGTLDTLLGSLPRPNRWSDLRRHLHFGQIGDLQDIIQMDWPEVSKGLETELYGSEEPMPVGVNDLGSLSPATDTTGLASGFDWESLNPEEFERLIFVLIDSTQNYENPQWLTHENAPDRGRDMSVTRVIRDDLTGMQQERVIVQCRHRRSNSVSSRDVSELVDQMRLWEPPPVDRLIIATSGRFTSDAVGVIERRNHAEKLQIVMWPESEIERLLSRSPNLIAQFGLRR